MANERKRRGEERLKLDRTIRNFYEGIISADEFIYYHWKDSWDALIKYVQDSGFNMRQGKLPKELLAKKDEFETALTKYNREIAKDHTIDWTPWIKTKSFESNMANVYNKKITFKRFVQGYGGTWEELLSSMRASKNAKLKNGISQEFLDREDEFEAALRDYFENEYCKMTKILVGDKHVSPTMEMVDKCIEYLRQNDIGLGKKYIEETVRRYLRGEIQLEERHLTQIEKQLDSEEKTLSQLRNALESNHMDMEGIKKVAGEIARINQEIESNQHEVDKLDVDDVKDMSENSISEIDDI